jgi:16S rRNA C967 or C1407 C5-methylase (RsmB/RsmF family)/NOL1/NOP2/fmu family ribosome biogenesis protein
MSHPLPDKFIQRINNDSFFDSDFLANLDSTPPVSVRFHPEKVKSKLEVLDAVSWCENGFYLKERPSFTLDPLFHAGSYYPQEAGSMILDAILKQIDLPDDPILLDLCAAPGGKSTLISSFLNGKGLLVSNEVIQNRARILRENTVKWGYTNTIVTSNDPADFSRLPNFFDALIIDAPCSGEGMFRKDKAARDEWSEDNVMVCSARQKRILADVWESLKPGGFIIYSTCTFNSSENEENVSWLCEEFGAEEISLIMPDEIHKGRGGHGHYCLPGINKTEGFYVAVLQKPDETFRNSKWNKRPEFRKQKESAGLDEFVRLEDAALYNWNERMLVLPAKMEAEMLHVQAALRLLKMGTMVGENSRKGLIPSEELAMDFNLLSFPRKTELSRQDALNYLHGDTFDLGEGNGFCLVTFEQQPLGWIKRVNKRFNNLYPKEWRIRMQIN